MDLSAMTIEQALEPALDIAESGAFGLHSDIRRSKILIVDDSTLIRQLIHRTLSQAGFSELRFAKDGEEAIESVLVDTPDLIVLDIQMPRIDGYQVCSTLRQHDETSDLPIIVQTAHDDADARARVFQVGATDIIGKPINPPELVARVRLQLENRLLIRNLTSHNERLRQELDAAHEMQAFLQPTTTQIRDLEERHAIKIESFTDTSSELGGDNWGIWSLDDNRLAFHMVDFSGHGVVAALNVFRLHTLMQEHKDEVFDPAGFLWRLNHLLTAVLPIGQFATMICGYLDRPDNQLVYASASAPSPIITRQGGKEPPIFIDSSGLPLGISRDAHHEVRRVPFEPGDHLFLYSDAVTEALDAQGNAVEESGLVGLIEASLTDGGLETVVQRSLAGFYSRVSLPITDDLTAIGILRTANRS